MATVSVWYLWETKKCLGMPDSDNTSAHVHDDMLAKYFSRKHERGEVFLKPTTRVSPEKKNILSPWNS